MAFILSFALKNLSRHRRRTIITASAIAFGIGVFIWMDAFLLGVEKDSERNIIWFETGSAKIMNREYWEEIDHMAVKHAIDDPLRLVRELDLGNTKHTRRITFGGEIFFEEGSLPVKMVGIDPNTDGEVFRLEETLIEGSRYLRSGESEVLIGHWLADDLGAKIGDTVEVRTRTRHGAMQTIELEVVGIISCPNPLINKGVGFLPLSVAQYDLDMEAAATEIALAFPERSNVENRLQEIRPLLHAKFPNTTVLSWQELARDFVALAEMKTMSSRIMIFMILVIAAIGISNTMLIAVYERVREIGMMRAMGMQDSSIRLSFLFEAGGIGLIGSLFGIVLGALATYPMVRWGIDYSSIIGRMDVGYRIYGIYRAVWHPEAMVVAFVVGTLLSIAVALIPASRALKMKITDCLRYE